jgi:hypothetical protein
MADTVRLTREEWADLEPRLKAAERTAHESYMGSEEVRALVGDTDKTPPYLLLQHLRALKDEDAVRLFRATEMYYHELTRADITAAFLRGKEVGETGGERNDR